MSFQLKSTYKPTGDQPEAIEKLTEGISKNFKHQTLLGVTGSGKTFTVANVIQNVQKPTLVISHNKTLAAQLYQEFRDFFPNNAVCYFVSYYDYYQPEAYIPTTDTYIEKETEVNEEIDRLRLAATTALSTRDDVIVVASVSAIYNLGSPMEYKKSRLDLANDQTWSRNDLLSNFARLQYERNDVDFMRGTYRIRGENVEIIPAYENNGLRLSFLGEKINKIEEIHPLTGDTLKTLTQIALYPAKHYVAAPDTQEKARQEIKKELDTQIKYFQSIGKNLEAHRIKQRTTYDLEMIKAFGYCKGIENYSRYFDNRKAGEIPHSLLEHFPKDYLMVIDESHMTIPQIGGMYNGDHSRKQMLIDFGFRLPSAFDNRPLRFEEFARLENQVIYTSATPADYEISQSDQVVEQLVRPTGLIDPLISVRKSKGQITDLIAEVEKRVANKQRTLVSTLTKRMAEELTTFLEERKVKVQYLHSEVQTFDRSDILDDLRLGNYDVLVGVNLLREGLDLPEVSLVVVLDADKEGFLRSDTALIQTMGRAARHVDGKVILYADNVTGSMKRAIDEVKRRRDIQLKYNKKHHITPKTIQKPMRDKLIDREKVDDEKKKLYQDAIIGSALKRAEEGSLMGDDKEKLLKVLNREMKEAARILDFEKATVLRDQILSLKS